VNRQWAAAAVAAVAIAVATSLAIAQSGDDTDYPAPATAAGPASPADVALVHTVASRAHVPGGGFRDLTDLLPNIKYRQADGPPRPLVDLVVRGRVIRVEPGVAFRNFEEGERTENVTTDITPVAHDDPRADFRTSHLVVNVVEEIGDFELPAPAEIRVGVIHDRPIDLRALTRGLQAADSFVFFLSAGSELFAYDRTVYAIAADATLLTQVAPDGRLSLPGLEPKRAKGLLRTASTLAQLKEFAEKGEEIREARKVRGIA
jgi:hypothetical protein